MRLTAGDRLRPYAIEGPIGAGGWARSIAPVTPPSSGTWRSRCCRPRFRPTPTRPCFEREAKAVAALSHPNILAIHDFAADGATAYVVMELLEGATLRERLADGPLPIKKAALIARDVALGLAAAHDAGLVHRDIKPENIFITAAGHVKILDFGLARPMHVTAADAANSPTFIRKTDPGTVMGTIGYMSPEQVKGLAADHRSDIFSLGCTLFEMVSGRKPFERLTSAETMTAVLREDPVEIGCGRGSAALVQR